MSAVNQSQRKLVMLFLGLTFATLLPIIVWNLTR